MKIDSEMILSFSLFLRPTSRISKINLDQRGNFLLCKTNMETWWSIKSCHSGHSQLLMSIYFLKHGKLYHISWKHFIFNNNNNNNNKSIEIFASACQTMNHFFLVCSRWKMISEKKNQIKSSSILINHLYYECVVNCVKF